MGVEVDSIREAVRAGFSFWIILVWRVFWKDRRVVMVSVASEARVRVRIVIITCCDNVMHCGFIFGLTFLLQNHLNILNRTHRFLLPFNNIHVLNL